MHVLVRVIARSRAVLGRSGFLFGGVDMRALHSPPRWSSPLRRRLRLDEAGQILKGRSETHSVVHGRDPVGNIVSNDLDSRAAGLLANRPRHQHGPGELGRVGVEVNGLKDAVIGNDFEETNLDDIPGWIRPGGRVNWSWWSRR